MSEKIGMIVNQLRKEKNMTLKSLGEKTSLSAGFLSQFERGKTTIAVDSLMQIAEALETNLNYLIRQDNSSDNSFIHRSYENAMMYTENDRQINMKITHRLNDLHFLPKLAIILPNASDDEPEEPLRHGGHEFIYVLEGVLTIDMEGSLHDLFPGDTAYYESCRLHMWRNRTNKIIKILTVHFPNIFNTGTPI
ncbi:MAG: XRE family transcriptional regulator [Clostridiales Family XIII bacterium]|jgi:transcriptional regulator with XRE-family HTH domain|nr:XRE family transcriptional regulator [Clostridiales Family XIII bacterium]